MHYSEWSSILNNLFTNAKKSIKKMNIEGKILIKAGADQNGLYVEFSDNGCGIPDNIKDRVFDAFLLPQRHLVDFRQKANQSAQVLV